MEQRNFNIATGQNRFTKVWRNESLPWEELRARLADCKDTGETAAEYRKASREKQTAIKDVGGFVGGYLREGIRKADHVEARSVVTLDYDEFHPSRVEDVRKALPCVWLMHSTHKHTAEQWRVRLVIPLSRDVSVDEYGAVARRMAERIGFDGIDRSTFEPCRLMFWASRSTDAPYVLEEGKARNFLDVDSILGTYSDWRDQSAWPMLPEEAPLLRLIAKKETPTDARKGGKLLATDKEAQQIYSALLKSGRKAEDPLQKEGPVGTFCRAHSIPEVIALYLSDTYTQSSPGRYTHTGSTTHGGAIVLDQGRFLYSFHATDPASSRLLNAWDLVRVHKFEHLDASADPNTRTARKPSFREMEKLAMADATYTALLAEERRAKVRGEFDGIDLSEEENEDERWKKIYSALPWQKDGSCKSTITAAATILMNDPAVAGKLRYNLFTHETDVFGELPWKRENPQWTNEDESNLRCWFDAKYGITGKEKISDAFIKAITTLSYHPIKNYLQGLQWDGEKRLGRIFADVLGADDTPLNSRLSEMLFTAAVRRIYQPGAKFDYFIILQGPEGTGKSSLFEIMGGRWFKDSVVSIEGKEGMESLKGVWIAEIGELIAVKGQKMQNAVKAYISRCVDKYRPAYGRVEESHPRQCVIVGTTNETDILYGIDTGNRRSPVVEIKPELRKSELTVREYVTKWRDQLWAEAMALHRSGAKIYLDQAHEAEVKKIQEKFNADLNKPIWGEVTRFLDMLLPGGWEMMTAEERATWRAANPNGETEDYGYPREHVCVAEILQEGIGMKRTDPGYIKMGREIGAFMNTLKNQWHFAGGRRTKIYGYQKTWDNAKKGNTTSARFQFNDL